MGTGSTGPRRWRRRWRSAVRVVAVNAVLVLIVLGLVEALLAWLLAHPSVLAGLPANLRDGLRVYYSDVDRRIVQFRPECARFDAQLFYTLKPGHCTFANREFRTRLTINSAGTRDGESALEVPEVIVLGDSLTMGWGVEQNEAFPQTLARLSGLRVLNAGVSSYGTVRELMLLERLDLDALRYLVLQYSRNDGEENVTFLKEGNRLPVSDETRYERLRDEHLATQIYYPGKHAFHLLRVRRYSRALLRRLVGGEPAARVYDPPLDRQVVAFVNALEHAARLPDVPILLIDLNGNGYNDTEFLDAVGETLRETGSKLARRVVPVDVSTVLDRSHYYLLDDHLRAEGHREVGRLLCRELAALDPTLSCGS